MSAKIKEFLYKLSQETNLHMFLLYNFYYNPADVLGGSEDETLKEYYNYGMVKELIKIPQFFEFLQLCMSDIDFCKRIENDGINNNLLAKIRYLIFDFQDYRDNYNEDLEKEELKNVIKNKAPMGAYKDKYGIGGLISIQQHFEKCEWLYDLGIPHENTLEVSDNLLFNLICRNNLALDVFYEKYEEIPMLEDNLMKSMARGDFESLERVLGVITDFTFVNKKYTKALVCSNKFLELCVSELLDKEISYFDINRIMALIKTSINLYNFNISLELEWLYYLIGENKRKEYNIELAKFVLDKFSEKLVSTKLIRLY